MRVKLPLQKRYRVQPRLLRKPMLVLQIECEDMVQLSFGAVEKVSRWRDATLEDISLEATT